MTSADRPTLAEAVTAALGEVEEQPRDQGAVRLALGYAEQIDGDSDQLGKLGPLLLAVLESLCLTPRARAAVIGKGGGQRDGVSRSKLDELHERRAAWQPDPAPVDPSAS